MIFLILIGDYLLKSGDLSQISPYLWLVSLSVFGGGIYSIFNYWAIRDKSYTDIAKSKFYQSLWGSIGKIIFGIFGISPLGLMIGDFFNRFAGSITLVRLFFKKNQTLLDIISWDSMIQVLKEYYRFPLYSCPSAIINTLAFQMPALVLIFYFSPEIAGYYSLAYGIMVLPMSIISGSVAQVYLGEIAVFIENGSNLIKNFYCTTIYKLSIFSVPSVIFIAIIAPYVFPILFGSIWKEAGIYCIALASVVITQFIFSTTSILHFCGKNKWVLFFDISRTFFVLCIFCICLNFKCSAYITLATYSTVMSMMYIANYFINLKAIAGIVEHK